MSILFCGLATEVEAAATQALVEREVVLVSARDVSDALRRLNGSSPSIAVVGGSPSEVAIEACKQLRRSPAFRDAVLVAVTSGPEDGRLLLEAGADDFHLEALGNGAFQSRLVVARRLVATRAARRSAEQDREQFATTLDSIGDAVITTDREGAVTRMNPVAEAITGWPIAEARGRMLHEVFPLINVDTRLAVENPSDRPLREGIVVALPRRTLLVRRDGTEILVADSCAPIRSGNGLIRGVVLVFRDLTALRSLELAQARLERHLVFTDRMASLGALAAGVAHEINNPLSYVSANVEMAFEELRTLPDPSKEIRVMLVDARDGIERVTKVVRGLKTFSRLDEERRTVVAVLPMIELAISMAGNEVRHRARLRREMGVIPLVDADSARLGQVFVNLLVNAAHSFAEREIAENEIAVVTSTDPEGRAVVEIRDNGLGIPPEVIGRVFEPFFTTKPSGIGTGLGLAVSRNIVMGMGGEISVHSEVGRGTVFRVVLPASTAREATPKAVEKERSTAPPARSGIVLVVDDEPAVGTAIRRVLRHHDVTVVTTGRDALELLAAGRQFDVVLSDLMMPIMSGMELHAAIVQQYPETASRVVFITGGAFTPEADAFFDRVTNERMTKPFDPQALRSLVQRLIG